MHLTTLAFAIILSGSPGPTAWPESLSKPLLAKVEFTWPRPAVFDSKWSEAAKHDTGRTVLQFAIDGKTQWYVVSPDGRFGAFRLEALLAREVRYTDSVTGQTLKVWSWEKEKATEVEVLEREEGKVTPDALVPMTYVSTLLESNGPLYAEERKAAPELRDLVDSFSSVPEAKRVAKIAEWARANRTDAALFERFRSYRPMGSCSMDTAPQETARVFAELAFARGDLGRFLQLQIDIMGDNFARTAYSSYGEAAHNTEAERLTSTGIDLDQFLLGLVVATQDRGPTIDSWRLARAIKEAGRTTTLVPKLQALATSPTLDAYNRLRATQVWLFAQLPAEQPYLRDEKAARATRETLIANGRKLSLHPLAREWLQKP